TDHGWQLQREFIGHLDELSTNGLENPLRPYKQWAPSNGRDRIARAAFAVIRLFQAGYLIMTLAGVAVIVLPAVAFGRTAAITGTDHTVSSAIAAFAAVFASVGVLLAAYRQWWTITVNGQMPTKSWAKIVLAVAIAINLGAAATVAAGLYWGW